jgi:hypothetical protein
MKTVSNYYVISLKSKSLLKILNSRSNFDEKTNELAENNIILKKICKILYDKYDPIMIYCFNNEINLVFVNNDSALYNGNISKLVCNIASCASVLSSKQVKEDIYFDGMFLEFTKTCELLNYLVWRQFDCRRNTVTSLYKCFIGDLPIDNISVEEMEKCFDVPKDLFYGTVMKKCMVAYTKGDENQTIIRNKVVCNHFYLAEDFSNVLEKYLGTKYLL